MPNAATHASLSAAVDTVFDQQVAFLQDIVRFPSRRGEEAPLQDWIARDFARRTTAVNDTRYYGRYYDIPALCYGPKGEGNHGFDERTSLPDLKRCTLTMAQFIADWCGVVPI